MYQYYTGIADSVGNLSSNTYQYATDVQEVMRYLKGVTGEDISLENLYPVSYTHLIEATAEGIKKARETEVPE